MFAPGVKQGWKHGRSVDVTETTWAARVPRERRARTSPPEEGALHMAVSRLQQDHKALVGSYQGKVLIKPVFKLTDLRSRNPPRGRQDWSGLLISPVVLEAVCGAAGALWLLKGR